MPSLLRRPVSAGARPCPGRSSLDMGCAPAEYGSYQEARIGTISQIKVSTLSGEPRRAPSQLSPGRPARASVCSLAGPGVMMALEINTSQMRGCRAALTDAGLGEVRFVKVVGL